MTAASHLRKLAIHERWWFYVWTIWGLIVAGIVFCIDRSVMSSLAWVAAGFFAGVFGQTIWEWICQPLISFAARQMGRSELKFDAGEDDLDERILAWVTSFTLDLVDPRRKPWEVYPGIFLAVGLVHGLLVGAVYGSLLPVLDDSSRTSFQSACLGLVVGPLLVSLLYAVVTPILFLHQFRGPSIEPIRDTVRNAVEEANHLGHDAVIPAHLLLAILRHPTGRAAMFFQEHEALLPRSANYLRYQLGERSVTSYYSEDASSLFDILEKAISEAKALHHKEMDPAHLLLTMLDSCSNETIDVLKKAGFTADELRPRLVDSLSRPAH